MITGPAADWLRRNREGLNQRVRLARHQGGRPDPALLTAWLERLLPALCAQQAGEAMLQAAFDLVLLLAAQNRLPAVALAAGDAQGRLLEALPDLVPTMNARPDLLAAWSNAVGNLARGREFAASLPGLATACPLERLLEAGAVLAWRLGEPRLRQRALAIATTLPPAAAATALDLPAPQLKDALAQLVANAWRRPGRPADVVQIGDFTGFGGPFAVPPLLLDASLGHSLSVLCGGTRHRIAADAFGWHCQPDSGTAGSPAKATVPAAAKPLVSRCSSWVLLQPGVLACTRPDSFRIRILAVEGG